LVYRKTKEINQKLEQRFESIMQAAREEFAQHGFYGTSVKDIARRAGVGTGTIYLYLKNKETLFSVLVNKTYEMILNRITEARKNVTGARQKLTVSMETVLKTFQENRSLAWVMLVQAPKSYPVVAEQLYDLLKRLIDFVEADITESIHNGELPPQNSRLVASAFIGTFYQVVISWLKEDISSNLTEVSKELVAYNLRGLGYASDGEGLGG